MTYSLSFNISGSPSDNIIEFPTAELKEAYIEAELKNLKCQNAYFKYCAAFNKKERELTAKKLDEARLKFYKIWASKNIKHAPTEKEVA